MPLPAHIHDDKRFGLVMSCERCRKRITRAVRTETPTAWTARRKEFIRIHWDCPKSRLEGPRK